MLQKFGAYSVVEYTQNATTNKQSIFYKILDFIISKLFQINAKKEGISTLFFFSLTYQKLPLVSERKDNGFWFTRRYSFKLFSKYSRIHRGRSGSFKSRKAKL